MKAKTILHLLLLLVISAALIFITYSFTHSYTSAFLMSLGILMLLLFIDNLLRQYDNKRRRKWEEKKRKEELQ